MENIRTNTKQLIYVPEFKAQPLAAGSVLEGKNILIIHADEQFASQVESKFNENNTVCKLVVNGTNNSKQANTYTIENSIDGFSWLISTLSGDGNLPDTVIHCSPSENLTFEQQHIDSNLKNNFYSLFYFVQSLIVSKINKNIQLLYVNMQEAENENPLSNAMFPFLRTVILENSRLSAKSVSISQNTDLIGTIANEIGSTEWNQEIRYGGNTRFVKNLIKKSEDQKPETVACKEGGVYVITGGAGGLGKIVTEYFVAQNQNISLVLTGRSKLDDKKQAWLTSLQSDKAQIEYISSDIANQQEAESLIKQIMQKHKKIDGVLHSAGVIRDSFILKKTKAEAEAVFSAKIFGTIYLDKALGNTNLDFFALFSSTSGYFGNFGQCDYSYANSFQDKYAAYRNTLAQNNQRKGHAISINWPLWEEGKMQIDKTSIQTLKEQTGIEPLPTQEGLSVLSLALQSKHSQLMALYGNAEKIEQFVSGINSPAIIKAAVPQALTDTKHLQPQVETFLKEAIGEVLKMPADKINAETNLEEYGVDSVSINQFNVLIEEKFKSLPKTILFEYQNIAGLSEYIVENHQDEVASLFSHLSNETSAEITETVPSSNYTDWEDLSPLKFNKELLISKASKETEDIAIIGISGRYPESGDLGEFWENLKNGKDCISEIPADRWSVEDHYDPDPNMVKKGKAYSKWGGFVKDVDKFDPLFFNISKREAETMDPQERMFLEVAWETFEDAGYAPTDLGKKGNSNNIGVFVGVTTNSYHLLGFKEWEKNNFIIPKSTSWTIANRISYTLNLAGPSLPVDTACSSSLTALHMACESLRKKECDTAIAGGTNLYLHPSKYVAMCEIGMLSPSGKCHSFGDKADGFVPGEGIGAVLLKPLSKAIDDNDHIYGIIKSTEVNHGGKTNGYTVPNPNAQTEIIKKCIDKANIDPRSITFFEAHGTGTSLGDPIEVRGITKAFNQYSKDNQYCALGSVKANIGHLEAAAGIAGLTKILLAFQHQQLPPSINADTINPNIDFSKTPLYLQKELTELKRKNGMPFRSAISSFGAGGANAHMIVEEHIPHPSMQTDNPESVFVLSAKDSDRLKAYAQKIIKFLGNSTQQAELNFRDFLFTLQTGRTAFDERLAFVTANSKDCIAKLQAYCSGSETLEYYTSNIKKRDRNHISISEFIEDDVLKRLLKNEEYSKLARLWVHGADINWKDLYDFTPRKMPLPAYPFKKERCWIPQMQAFEELHTQENIHPLLQKNISKLGEIKFESKFTSSSPYLSDTGSSKRMMPHEYFIEIFYQAAKHATETKLSTISNLTFGKTASDTNSIKLQTSIYENQHSYVIESIVAGQEQTQGAICQAELGFKNQLGVKSNFIEFARYQTLNRNNFINEYLPQSADNFVEQVYRAENELIVKCTQSVSETEDFKFPLTALFYIPYVTAAVCGQKQAVYLQKIRNISLYDHNRPLAYIKLSKRNSVIDFAFISDSHETIAEFTGVELLSAIDSKTAQNTTKNYVLELLKPTVKESVPSASTSAVRSALLFAPNKAFADAFMKAHSAPQSSIIVIQSDKTRKLADKLYEADTSDEKSCAQLFEILLKDGLKPQAVIHAHALHQSEEESANNNPTHSVLNVFKNLIRNKVKPFSSFLIVAPKQNNINSVVSQSISSMPLSLAMVAPEKHSSCLLLDEFSDLEKTISIILQETAGPNSNEKEILYTGNKRYTKQLEAASVHQSGNGIKNGGVYIITGGMGGLGFIVSSYLAKNYNTKLVLSGRRAITDKIKQKLAQLESFNAKCIYVQADVSDKKDTERLIAEAKKHFKQINGIIHAAGVTDEKLVTDKSQENTETILAPKIQGTYHLDQFTKNDPLDFIALFSSTSSVFGDFGQCDYAISNRFLDDFAEYRNQLAGQGQRKGHTVSISWPLWREGGMHASDDFEDVYLNISGFQYLETADGLRLFDNAVSQQALSHMLIFSGEENRLNKLLNKHQQPIVDTDAVSIEETQTEAVQFASTQDWLLHSAARTLKIAESDIDITENLGYYGFDSISLKELAKIIQYRFDAEISPSIFFAKNTIKDLSEYLEEEFKEQLAQERPVNAEPASPAVSSKATAVTVREANYAVLPLFAKDKKNRSSFQAKPATEDVAIIGADGVFPGAKNLDEFWENIKTAKDCINEIPLERWDWRKDFDANGNGELSSNSKWAGLIDDYDKFDAAFFKISPREAKVIDPQHRIFLQSVWKTVEDAGYRMSAFSGKPVGVFAGVQFNDYLMMLSGMDKSVAQIATGTSHAILANRVSYLFNFHGPSEAIDTACSSSLVALNRAVKAIQSGECELAIAGGVSLILSPASIIAASKMGILSPTGSCKTFDASADGYVKGEGVGTVLLKPLSKAIEDGDNIYAVIKGINVNHGGKANSLTAPNSDAQAQLIINTHLKAGIEPQSIGYVEAHGTGTVLGDPVEIDGLKKSFKTIYESRNETCDKLNYCGISSVKTQIGHLEPAAGIAGVLKSVLAMQNETIPPTVHFKTQNPYIKLEGSPFYITDALKKWEPLAAPSGLPYPRRSTVSSFGFGGANAHVVLEEYKTETNQKSSTEAEQVFIFSAKSKKSLVQGMRNYNMFFKKHPHKYSLSDIAFTLQTGREPMNERLAIVARSVEELKAAIGAYLDNKTTNNTFSSNTPQTSASNSATINKHIEEGNWKALAENWAAGQTVEWSKLHENKTRKRVSLPSYCFDLKRYWFKEEDAIKEILGHQHQVNNEFVKTDNAMNTSKKDEIAHGPFRPVNKDIIKSQTNEVLSDTKKKYLEQFIEHYCKKNQLSKEHTIKYRDVYADQRAIAFFHMTVKDLCFPLVFQKAEGAKIWDIDNNEYIDIATDFGVNLFGHQPEFLKKALIKQINEGLALGMRPEKSALAAALLCEITAMDRAVFTQSGSEAVMTAIRLARQVSNKQKIVIFTNSYHGHSDVVLGYSTVENGKLVTKPMVDGVPASVVENLIVLQYTDPEALQIIEQHKHELAAVLVEPMQSRGLKLKPESFLKKLEVFTKSNEIALIFDEMITGLRTMPGGAQEYYGVKANIATYGKVLGGGLGVGAVAGDAKYLNAIDGGTWQYGDNSFPTTERTFFAGTHSQNTLTMASVHAVLTELKSRGAGLQEEINKKCEFLCSSVNTFFDAEEVPVNMFYFGSLFRFEFINNYKNPLELNLLYYHLRDNGIMVSEIGNNFLSDAHTYDDIEKIIAAVKNSVKYMKLGGYFQKKVKKQAKPAQNSGSLIGDIMSQINS